MDRLNELSQYLGETMQGLLGGSGTVMLVLIFMAVFLAVMAIAGIVMGLRSPVERRLAGEAGQIQNDSDSGLSLRGERQVKTWDKVMRSIEKTFTPTDHAKRSTLESRLIQAGYMGSTAIRNYYAVRVLLAILLPMLFLGWASVYPHSMSAQKVLLLSGVFGLMGIILPPYWLYRRTKSRQLAVTEAFPDALDMLMVCVESGLGLDAAFSRVGTQIARSHPLLAYHFGWVSLELRAGKTRPDALRNLASRVGLAEIQSFATLLIQSDSLGTSVAQTLRVYADEMRAKRMLKAEEKAQMLPVLLSIPLVTCILPTIITVVLLPGIIRIAHTLVPLLTNQ